MSPSAAAVDRIEEPPIPVAPVLVDRIVRELGPELARLARRARGMGTPAQGTTILLTGCRRGIGCTTVALALARAAAVDHTVLLIDGDLLQPNLAAGCGISPSCGWDEALRESSPWEETALAIPAAPQLTLLPLRRPVADRPALWADPVFSRAYHRLRRAYDLLVLDGGSVWHGGADWAAWADVALVVCDSGNKLAEDWARAWDRLEAGGIPVLGIIETLG